MRGNASYPIAWRLLAEAVGATLLAGGALAINFASDLGLGGIGLLTGVFVTTNHAGGAFATCAALLHTLVCGADVSIFAVEVLATAIHTSFLGGVTDLALATEAVFVTASFASAVGVAVFASTTGSVVSTSSLLTGVVGADVSSATVYIAATSSLALVLFADLASATLRVTRTLNCCTFTALARSATGTVVGGTTAFDTESAAADLTQVTLLVAGAGVGGVGALVVLAGLAFATVAITSAAFGTGSASLRTDFAFATVSVGATNATLTTTAYTKFVFATIVVSLTTFGTRVAATDFAVATIGVGGTTGLALTSATVLTTSAINVSFAGSASIGVVVVCVAVVVTVGISVVVVVSAVVVTVGISIVVVVSAVAGIGIATVLSAAALGFQVGAVFVGLATGATVLLFVTDPATGAVVVTTAFCGHLLGRLLAAIFVTDLTHGTMPTFGACVGVVVGTVVVGARDGYIVSVTVRVARVALTVVSPGVVTETSSQGSSCENEECEHSKK